MKKNIIDEKVEVEPKNKENENEFKKVDAKSKQIEKDKQKMEVDKKDSKKWKKIVIAIGIMLLLIAILSTIFAIFNMGNEKIISGVSISGVEVSGLSKEEAKDKIDTIYNEKMQKEINVKYEDYESNLNPSLMEVQYDTENAVNEAYMIGKGNNIFVNNYEILNAMIFKKDIHTNMVLNEQATKQSIQDIGVNLPGVVVESTHYIEDEELIITRGKAGISINIEELLNKVKEKLNNIDNNEDYIEIPIEQRTPEVIDINKIHEDVYKEVKDAYYTKDPFTIYPEVEGIDFDIEQAKQTIAAEDKDEYVIKLVITKPKITTSSIGAEAFPDQLATFTTRYDASNTDRTTNLKIACEKLNGKVVLSGDTLSYNKTLGERTVAAGYRNGKIYSNGEVVDGIGGGICQISSTLYNAVLMANLEITERRNHQFVTSYLPAGRDATVVYGTTDFIFKNTRKYPIRLVATAQNGIATISVYGIKEETEYTFNFETKTIATIPYSTKYQEDASLPVGTENVKQKGVNGIQTETYITKMLNGKVVSKTLLSRDTYNAMNKIIIKGTAGSSEVIQKEPVNNITDTKANTVINETNVNNVIQNNAVNNNTTNTTQNSVKN